MLLTLQDNTPPPGIVENSHKKTDQKHSQQKLIQMNDAPMIVEAEQEQEQEEEEEKGGNDRGQKANLQ